MAHKHRKHAHKTHSVGKKRRRARMGGFTKSGLMEAGTIAGTALVTKVALDYATPKIVAALGTTATPTMVNYGKVVLGIAAASFAEGRYKPFIEGVATALVLDGGSKIATSMINGTPMISGTINMPVRYPMRSTIAGLPGAVRSPMPGTIAGRRNRRMVAI